MRRLGYEPGMGLRRNNNGMTEPYIPPLRIGCEGLGYNWKSREAKKPYWTLAEHFVSKFFYNPNQVSDPEIRSNRL